MSVTPMAAQAGAFTAARRVGRFELLRELGRGAQATVWLAHDPRLDREVALKLFHAAADHPTVSHWLHEAQAVSRLTHPHIVPVFEAGAPPHPPYLVFEFVAGPTLAEARRQRRQWPPREAVTLMLDVLAALAAAHAQGIVHRDLKPSNVLLGADGRARVMDFGIAARVAPSPGRPGAPSAGSADRGHQLVDMTAGLIVGTPGYISPEAARGEAPQPAMDVFAAGVVLAELLAGESLLEETDPWRAVQRVQQEDLMLPPEAPVDETLRGIVQRALSRDAGLRYESASALRAVLSAWLQPPAAAQPDASAGVDDSHETLKFLLRRMRHKTDFPALSAQVARILRLTGSETAGLNRLADEILLDVGLTHKLLRMVNAAHFTAVIDGGVGSVSRAVALVGIAGIRNLVLSALLLEHMGDKAHAARMQREFLRALMAGTLARELSPLARESEEAFLAGMLQNLGKLLTEYYFPEEAVQIRARPLAGEPGEGGLEHDARRVLGIGFDALTAGVARAWGLPVRLRRMLVAAESTVGPAMHGLACGDEAAIERLRRLGQGANELTDVLLASDASAQAEALAAAAPRLAERLGCSVDDVVLATHGARVRLRQLVEAMGWRAGEAVATQRLLGLAPATRRGEAAPSSATGIQVLPEPDAQTAPGHAGTAPPAAVVCAPSAGVRSAPSAGVGSALSAHLRLAHGLGEIRRAHAAKTLSRNDLLQLVLETMRRALDLRCAVICLREAGSGSITGRFGVGAGAGEARAAFRIATDGAVANDLFAALCAKGADLLVADAARLAARLPAWYRQRVNAPTFLLLPMMDQGAAVGLIYGDKAVAGTLALSDAELGLLRALRDHAVDACRSKG